MATKTEKEVLDDVASDVRSMKRRIARLEKKLTKEAHEEQEVEKDEEAELADLEELKQLEEQINKETAPHPLTRITYRDVTKGIIGSFFGIVGHFAFFYGGEIAVGLSIARANALMATSFVLLVLFIYFSGFRKVKAVRHHKWIPWRVLTIYLTAHIVIAFVLFLFGRIGPTMSFADIYKNVAAVSILAIMGAATADLIGG